MGRKTTASIKVKEKTMSPNVNLWQTWPQDSIERPSWPDRLCKAVSNRPRCGNTLKYTLSTKYTDFLEILECQQRLVSISVSRLAIFQPCARQPAADSPGTETVVVETEAIWVCLGATVARSWLMTAITTLRARGAAAAQ
jgi:hypothetical protein